MTNPDSESRDPSAEVRNPQSLTEFLLARIAEDEAAAHRMFRPARFLAECEAKRRIVELGPCRCSEHGDSAWLAAMRALAAVYADHPEWRGSWWP